MPLARSVRFSASKIGRFMDCSLDEQPRIEIRYYARKVFRKSIELLDAWRPMEATMKTSTRLQTTVALLTLALIAAQPAHAGEAWRTTGFKTPESVLYDAANKRLVVTNMNG